MKITIAPDNSLLCPIRVNQPSVLFSDVTSIYIKFYLGGGGGCLKKGCPIKYPSCIVTLVFYKY